jgi:uncharacterized protein (TIGR02001 family)
VGLAALISAPALAAEDIMPPKTKADGTAEGPFTLTGSFDVTSDYMFRGISQTDDGPAVQGGLNANYDFGGIVATAGFWASNVKLTPAAGTDNANIEMDGNLSLAGTIGDNLLTWAVGNTYYYYPNSGANSTRRFDYDEIWANLGHDFGFLALGGSVYYSPDFTFNSGSATYYNANVKAPVPFFKYVDLIGAVGHQEISNNGRAGVPDYTDYKLGAAVQIWGIGIEADAIKTSLSKADGNAVGNTTLCSTAACDWTYIVTATKTF